MKSFKQPKNKASTSQELPINIKLSAAKKQFKWEFGLSVGMESQRRSLTEDEELTADESHYQRSHQLKPNNFGEMPSHDSP